MNSFNIAANNPVDLQRTLESRTRRKVHDNFQSTGFKAAMEQTVFSNLGSQMMQSNAWPKQPNYDKTWNGPAGFYNQ